MWNSNLTKIKLQLIWCNVLYAYIKGVLLLFQTSGFNISGVKFESGSLGSRELCVRWRGLTDYVRLELVAGPPAKLTIPSWDVKQVCAMMDTLYQNSPFLHGISNRCVL